MAVIWRRNEKEHSDFDGEKFTKTSIYFVEYKLSESYLRSLTCFIVCFYLQFLLSTLFSSIIINHEEKW